MDEDLMNALHKLATGFTHSDMQDEQAADDTGKMKTVRRKVTRKYYPPDITALKTYLEVSTGRGAEALSDEELKSEKARLLAELSCMKPKSDAGRTISETAKKKANNNVKKKTTKK